MEQEEKAEDQKAAAQGLRTAFPAAEEAVQASCPATDQQRGRKET